MLRDHGRFSGAAQAAYQLGNLRYASGAYAQARGAYEVALAKGGPASLRALSAVGIGYTWEAEKNYANAAAAYEAALKTMAPKAFLYEDTLMALARVQELGGKPGAAVETYQRLLKEIPDTRRADDLKTHLANLKSRRRPVSARFRSERPVGRARISTSDKKHYVRFVSPEEEPSRLLTPRAHAAPAARSPARPCPRCGEWSWAGRSQSED